MVDQQSSELRAAFALPGVQDALFRLACEAARAQGRRLSACEDIRFGIRGDRITVHADGSLVVVARIPELVRQ